MPKLTVKHCCLYTFKSLKKLISKEDNSFSLYNNVPKNMRNQIKEKSLKAYQITNQEYKMEFLHLTNVDFPVTSVKTQQLRNLQSCV